MIHLTYFQIFKDAYFLLDSYSKMLHRYTTAHEVDAAVTKDQEQSGPVNRESRVDIEYETDVKFIEREILKVASINRSNLLGRDRHGDAYYFFHGVSGILVETAAFAPRIDGSAVEPVRTVQPPPALEETTTDPSLSLKLHLSIYGVLPFWKLPVELRESSTQHAQRGTDNAIWSIIATVPELEALIDVLSPDVRWIGFEVIRSCE